MDFGLFLTGLVIGVIIAVPVGPIGVLCVSRALSGGPVYGLFSGLGVATGDAVSAGIAALGLSLVSGFLLDQQRWLRLIGGMFLFYIGGRTFLTHSRIQAAPATVGGVGVAYASTLLMTLSNPVTILSFVAIFAGWSVESLSGHYLSAAVLTGGVFLGSATWWLLLSGGLLAFRARFSHTALRLVHLFSGSLIAACGIAILLSTLW